MRLGRVRSRCSTGVLLAQDVARELRRLHHGSATPAVVLLHSRYRPLDRAAQLALALAEPDPLGGTIVVATQVIEAGVDVSCRLLVSETAPFSSIVQRLGRCNRAGEHSEARMLWLDRGDLDAKAAAPYRPDDLIAARSALLALVGESLSPSVLGDLDVWEHRDEALILRRRDLVDLFDTAPDIGDRHVDVSRFIRDGDERSRERVLSQLCRRRGVG